MLFCYRVVSAKCFGFRALHSLHIDSMNLFRRIEWNCADAVFVMPKRCNQNSYSNENRWPKKCTDEKSTDFESFIWILFWLFEFVSHTNRRYATVFSPFYPYWVHEIHFTAINLALHGFFKSFTSKFNTSEWTIHSMSNKEFIENIIMHKIVQERWDFHSNLKGNVIPKKKNVIYVLVHNWIQRYCEIHWICQIVHLNSTHYGICLQCDVAVSTAYAVCHVRCYGKCHPTTTVSEIWCEHLSVLVVWHILKSN